MAVVTVRNLSDETHRALKMRPASHGRSTEAEIREILDEAARWHRPRHYAQQVADRTRRVRMIILDINVVSEPMKADGNSAVFMWLDNQFAESLFLTAVSLSELLVGIKTLPEGKRE
jgi:plasmid stability protein